MRSLCTLTLILVLLPACASVDVVRLQPDLLQTPKGTEPLAGIQVECVGFYLFTIGIPECDMDRAVNDLLFKEARKLGAERLINLKFEGTPGGGIWWLTKLLGLRFASASAVALMVEAGEEKESGPAPPPMPIPPPPPPSPSPKTSPGL